MDLLSVKYKLVSPSSKSSVEFNPLIPVDEYGRPLILILEPIEPILIVPFDVIVIPPNVLLIVNVPEPVWIIWGLFDENVIPKSLVTSANDIFKSSVNSDILYIIIYVSLNY